MPPPGWRSRTTDRLAAKADGAVVFVRWRAACKPASASAGGSERAKKLARGARRSGDELGRRLFRIATNRSWT
jgi:hypothetical protein